MPFGLDAKSVAVGVVIGMFVVPRVLSVVAARKSAPAAA